MPAKVRDLDRMLTGKLRAEIEEGSKHTKYRIYHGAMLLATTALPRSYPEIGEGLLSQISKDLYVSRNQLQLLLRCPMSLQDYVDHVLREE